MANSTNKMEEKVLVTKIPKAPAWMSPLSERDKSHLLTICCHHTEGIEIFIDMRRRQVALTSALDGKVESCLRCRNIAIKLGIESGEIIPEDDLGNIEGADRKQEVKDRILEERLKPGGIDKEVLKELQNILKKGV